MSITATFWDKQGREFTITGEPGSNFGLRIDDAEARRLLWESGDDLPFHIMAAGYGEDDDWVGLTHEDVVDDVMDLDERIIKYEDFVENGWGPFEVSIEVPLAEGRVKYFGDDMNRLALEACGRIQRPELFDVLEPLVGPDGASDLIAALAAAGYVITEDDGDYSNTRDSARLYELLRDGQWEPDYEPGTQRLSFPHSQGLAELVGWSCVSCKEDVGWVKHEDAHRTATGTITFHFDCGHCGYGEGETFDLYGEEIDRWSGN